MDALSINNLYYNNIINNLNLNLKYSSFNILIGKNSSGKTTLVELILKMHKYSGDINIYTNQKEIGITTEKNILFDGTVFDNLIFPLQNQNIKNLKNIVYDFSKKFNIENILYKDIKELTNSQYKLIQILSSIIHNPKLIIIDDSLDDLIYSDKKTLLQYLKIKSSDNCILILTSSSDYLEYADNILILESGSIIKSLTYKELVDEEKLLNHNNIKIPFIYDMFNKLKFYNLIDDNPKSIDELVMKIWK